MSDASRHVSLEDLDADFYREVHTDKRTAAEIAYALAFRYRNEDVCGGRRFDLAKMWALRAIDLLDSLPSDCVDHVVSTRQSVGGIDLPDLLHADLVKHRLAGVLI